MTTDAEIVKAKKTTFVFERKTGGESPVMAAEGLEAKGLEGMIFEEMGARENWI